MLICCLSNKCSQEGANLLQLFNRYITLLKDILTYTQTHIRPYLKLATKDTYWRLVTWTSKLVYSVMRGGRINEYTVLDISVFSNIHCEKFLRFLDWYGYPNIVFSPRFFFRAFIPETFGSNLDQSLHLKKSRVVNWYLTKQ